MIQAPTHQELFLSVLDSVRHWDLGFLKNTPPLVPKWILYHIIAGKKCHKTFNYYLWFLKFFNTEFSIYWAAYFLFFNLKKKSKEAPLFQKILHENSTYKNKNDYGRISSGNKSSSVAKLSLAFPYLFYLPHRAHPPQWPPQGKRIPISTNQRPRNLLHRQETLDRHRDQLII